MQNYKEIDLSAWTKKGEGGNGTTYINEQEPGVILKVSHREDGLLEAVSKEFYTSKAIYDLGISTPEMIELVRVQDEYGIDLNHWLEGFRDTETSVRKTVKTIQTHPLIPKDVTVRGFIIDSVTGELQEIK